MYMCPICMMILFKLSMQQSVYLHQSNTITEISYLPIFSKNEKQTVNGIYTKCKPKLKTVFVPTANPADPLRVIYTHPCTYQNSLLFNHY